MLGDLGIPDKDVGERTAPHLSVGSDASDRSGQGFAVEVVVSEVGDVDEVAPASVSGGALEGGDDLLGENQLDGVAAHPDRRSAKDARYIDRLGRRPQRIADIHINVELDGG